MYILIAALPLLSATVLLSSGRKIGMSGSNIFSISCMGGTALLSYFLYYETAIIKSSLYIPVLNWIHLGSVSTEISFFIDSISGGMVLIVTTVSFLVHVYSSSYMDGDPHTPRFMGYLSLFTFFMLVLVSSQNFLQLFIGWEGVGLCSYLLVNYWFGRMQANKAAIKAMLVNRVGDAALVAAIVLLWMEYGSINFFTVFPTCPGEINTAIPVLLLVGAVGKSAQVGLHTWLPDAMEGPTPVSALIHAATMVTAGVYLIIRSSTLFEASNTALVATALIGSITALFAATVGLAQNDIKKIIAYSTCSQLGFMTLACGLSYYSVGLFHLINHAFFKALLFLTAGSVIHALKDEQDLRRMGSAIISLPLSYVFMLVGSLALAGTPFLAGFYSKDLLLELSTQQFYLLISCWFGLLATFFTAFYSFKLISRTFFLYKNSTKKGFLLSHEGEPSLLAPLVFLSLGSLFSGYILKGSLLGPMVHPPLCFSDKLVPLGISVAGSVLGLSLFVITKKFWSHLLRSSVITSYGFLASAWGFDKVISHYVAIPVWRFGHAVPYKLFDAGIIESFGPKGMSGKAISASQRLSLVQSGYLYNYATILLLCLALFVILN
uniref:NADH dehydrogenase subunit 5 n=1 Tax=Pelagia noctiluca TaxID=400838 RepID=UPI00257ABADB|nr:NADH dehydrogenase subunit 5 [Pelagia noctiluca]WIA66013.1 NADH dehydrogenase subunit 5 [Pelagia noctiluca]